MSAKSLDSVHLQIVDSRVRLYQEGYKEQVFTLEQLDKALENEQDYARALALNEAKSFLERSLEKPACVCLEYVGDNGPCPVRSHRGTGRN